MNGTGNDFIILNNLEEKIAPEHLSELAKILCERHLSIGADGLMVIDAPTQGGDYRMLFFNSDGSIGEMCGNGARCICRYGYENGLAGEIQRIETTAGLVTGQRIDKRNYRIRLNDPTVIQLEHPVEIDGVIYPCAYIELGNPGIPHVVVPYKNLKNLKQADEKLLRELGRKIRWHSSFPKGANVNFYEQIGKDQIYERTFERGVEDFTYACGTGTGSVVTALTLQGLVSGQNVQIEVRGGKLAVDIELDAGPEIDRSCNINQTNNQIKNLYLTGPTNLVCKGEVTDETLGELKE